jgi:hypothetical protein
MSGRPRPLPLPLLLLRQLPLRGGRRRRVIPPAAAAVQGLTLVHVRAQLEQLQDTFMS